jgi:hypothetical protein
VSIQFFLSIVENYCTVNSNGRKYYVCNKVKNVFNSISNIISGVYSIILRVCVAILYLVEKKIDWYIQSATYLIEYFLIYRNELLTYEIRNTPFDHIMCSVCINVYLFLCCFSSCSFSSCRVLFENHQPGKITIVRYFVIRALN